MKKNYFIMTIFIFVFFFLFSTSSVKAMEINSDFEYLNVTYDFADDVYYATYTFKPNETGLVKYYFRVEDIYLDTIEHNISNLEINDTSTENLADISFYLEESKEYYIKYKGILPEYAISFEPFLKQKPRNKYDKSSAPSAYFFQIRIDHPEKINLTKDKISGIDKFDFKKENGSLIFTAGDSYEVSNYYNVVIFRKLIFLSEKQRQEKIIYIISTLALVIIALLTIIGVIYSFKYLKKSKEDNI